MGGAVIEPETTLLPLSMVLKEMYLLTATYEGSPTELASGVRYSSGLITEGQRGGGYPRLSGGAAAGEESPPTGLSG
jgi:hypothetical protein